MPKHGWLWVLLVVQAMGCQQLQNAWDNLQKPTARVVGVRFADLSADAVTLDFDVQVSNPYPVGLPLTNLRYALSSGGSEFLNGQADSQGVVPAKGDHVVPVSARVAFADLLQVLQGVRLGSVVPYQAKMVFTADVPAVGLKELPVQQSGELPVPAPPVVSLQKIQWQELSFNNATAVLHMNVKNTNEFAIDLNRLGYGLTLAGRDIAQSSVANGLQLSSGASGPLQNTISFSPAQLGLAVFNILRGERADYTLAGDAEIGTSFGPLTMPFHNSGNALLQGN